MPRPTTPAAPGVTLQGLVSTTRGACLAAVEHGFERVQYLANQAKARAVRGEMDGASELLSSGDTELAKVTSQAASLASMEGSARDMVLGFI